MIALYAVDGAAHRVDGEAAFQGFLLDPVVGFCGRIEHRLGGAVGDEFQGPEQALAADVADVAVVTEALDRKSVV